VYKLRRRKMRFGISMWLYAMPQRSVLGSLRGSKQTYQAVSWVTYTPGDQISLSEWKRKSRNLKKLKVLLTLGLVTFLFLIGTSSPPSRPQSSVSLLITHHYSSFLSILHTFCVYYPHFSPSRIFDSPNLSLFRFAFLFVLLLPPRLSYFT
jgi:hypothetical protein